MPWWKKTALGALALLVLLYLGCIGYAYWPHPEQPAATLALEQDRFGEVEGHRLRYRRWGDHPDQPTVMFLHGFAGSLNAFSKVGPLLGEHVNVVAVDIMPFGLSDKPVDFDYRYRNQARLLAQFAKALKIDDLVIAGHSYGGTIASYMAATQPNVRKLVLIDPGIQGTGTPSFVRHMTFPFRRMGARFFTRRQFRKRFVSRSFVRPELVTDAFVDELLLSTRMEGYMDGMSSFFSQYMDVEVQWLFDHIKVPTLLIWGREDKNNPPRFGEEMDAALPDSRLVVIEGSGHYPHMEKPEQVVAAIRPFVERPHEADQADATDAAPPPTAPAEGPDGDAAAQRPAN